MKNQYFGDIGDYGKYGLLRFLAVRGISVSVNWYLTPDDGGSDGRFTDYLSNESYRKYSPVIFDALKEYVKVKGRRDVAVMEETDLIPKAKYYIKLLTFPEESSTSERKQIREIWHRQALSACSGSDLVFLDPDNGLRTNKPSFSKISCKYVLLEELADYYDAGQNIVYYCHKGRRTAQEWEEYKGQVHIKIPSAIVTGVTFHRGTQRSYIFVLQKESADTMKQYLSDFLASDWKDMFTLESIQYSVTLRYDDI